MDRWCFLVLSFVILFLPPYSFAENGVVWLLVDTKKLTLEVKKGKKTINVLKNIAIGRNGAGLKQRAGDDVTPKGHYKISWINEKSSFYRFYGFDYPSVENAKHALSRGLVTKDSYSAIIDAHKKKLLPPQNTTLGGTLGIHGLGRGDKKIHKTMNWTHGCIALTNEQIDQLDRWISEGIQVVVK